MHTSGQWRRQDVVQEGTTTTTPQPFYGPFSGTTQVSRCQKRTSGLLWCKERLTEADTQTIRLGATPSRLTSANLLHPPKGEQNYMKLFVAHKMTRNNTLNKVHLYILNAVSVRNAGRAQLSSE